MLKRLLLSLLLTQCLVFTNIYSQEQKDSIATSQEIQSDTTSYELLIFDIHFDSWFIKNRKMKEFYSIDYYKTKNRIAVINWNIHYSNNRYPSVIENHIDYSNTKEYGIDVEYKLFYYFEYVQTTYKIRLFN